MLILTSALPTRTYTQWGPEPHLVCSPLDPRAWSITGALRALYRPEQEAGTDPVVVIPSVHSRAASVLSDSVPRSKLRVGKQFPQTSLPLQVPIPSSPCTRRWGRMEELGWGEEGRKRTEGRRKSRRKTTVKAKCRYCLVFLPFSVYSLIHKGRGIRLNDSQLSCMTNTGPGQSRYSTNHIKEPMTQ